MKSNMIATLLMLTGTAATAQDLTPTIIKQDPMNTETQNHPLACTLSDAKLAERKSSLQKEVFSKVQQVEEMAHGYAFHFEDDQLLLRSLLAYVVAERSCCPFFEQQVTIKPNG
ncbi:MAG: hypothetical protein AAGA85_28420, partial [Bacteroidota bacterium]